MFPGIDSEENERLLLVPDSTSLSQRELSSSLLPRYLLLSHFFYLYLNCSHLSFLACTSLFLTPSSPLLGGTGEGGASAERLPSVTLLGSQSTSSTCTSCRSRSVSLIRLEWSECLLCRFHQRCEDAGEKRTFCYSFTTTASTRSS